jgi:hypothetical protein
MLDASAPTLRTASTGPTVRGALMVGLKKWLDENQGERGLRAIQAHLPEDERDLWDKGLLVHTARYSATAFSNFGRTAMQQWGRGDPRYLRDIGAFVAFNDLASYMKVMMKLGTPGFIARRFPRIWDHYFSAGALEISEHGDRHLSVEIKDWQPFGELSVFGAEGWMRAALEYSGAKRTSVRHEGTPNGPRSYEFRWS